MTDEYAGPDPDVPDLDVIAVVRGSRALAIAAGVVSLIAGVVLLTWPHATIKAVAFVVGFFLVVGGLTTAIDAIAARGAFTYWGLMLVRGLLDVVVGAMCIFWPAITVWALVVLLGIELILAGLLSVLVSRQVPKGTGSRHMWPGVVSIVAGVVVIGWPHATVWVMVLVLGFYLVLFGVLLLMTGYRLGKFERLAG